MKVLGKTVLSTLALAAALCVWPSSSQASVSISINIGPPALPVYIQPPCPVAGYHWNPGYWAYGPDGYYWIPGVWVQPPAIGVLWTPGYWGFAGGSYFWHSGYWGPHVGFYGGINYGFGYVGSGFFGGGWSGGVYRYNTAVTNVNTTVVRNVYVDRTVIRKTTIVNNNQVSFNGPGGVNARPSAQESAVAHEQHFQPTANQVSHQQTASLDRSQFASNNDGRPQRLAQPVPGNHPGKIGQRRAEQQARIAQGVGNGQLRPGQTSRIENQEHNINHQIAADRHAQGDNLTLAERQQIDREQNRTSREIHHDRAEGARHEEHR